MGIREEKESSSITFSSTYPDPALWTRLAHVRRLTRTSSPCPLKINGIKRIERLPAQPLRPPSLARLIKALQRIPRALAQLLQTVLAAPPTLTRSIGSIGEASDVGADRVAGHASRLCV